MTNNTQNETLDTNLKPTKKTAMQALAIMSDGYLKTMSFLQQYGMPQDLMIEAMRIGQQHGLCSRKDGFGVNAMPTMQYYNPYVELMGEPAKPIITETEGNA